MCQGVIWPEESGFKGWITKCGEEGLLNFCLISAQREDKGLLIITKATLRRPDTSAGELIDKFETV